jgi:glycosyltransferase involved in cell wall biosynthesis
MNNKHTLALCIPAYQAASHLPRLLQSAASQVIPFDEILVYDDASTDHTSDVAVRYGASVIRGSANIGCSAGKNVLLHSASSDWLHFHDSDDELLPDFTSLAHDWMAKDNCPDVVLFNYEYRENATNELIATRLFDDTLLEADPLRYAILNQINPFCGLYRRLRLLEVGGYDVDPEILYNEDVAFHCKLASAGFTFSADQRIAIVNYRMAGSMSSANQSKCLIAHVEVMRRLAIGPHGIHYALEIQQRLWEAATSLAFHRQWADVDFALKLASTLADGIPRNQGRLFSLLSFCLGPRISFRVREFLVRKLKPSMHRS